MHNSPKLSITIHNGETVLTTNFKEELNCTQKVPGAGCRDTVVYRKTY